MAVGQQRYKICVFCMNSEHGGFTRGDGRDRNKSSLLEADKKVLDEYFKPFNVEFEEIFGKQFDW